MPLLLPQSFQDKLVNAPEVSYGVNEVVLTLKDGRRYEHVLVAWGREIIKVDGSERIPFSENEIQAIEIMK